MIVLRNYNARRDWFGMFSTWNFFVYSEDIPGGNAALEQAAPAPRLILRQDGADVRASALDGGLATSKVSGSRTGGTELGSVHVVQVRVGLLPEQGQTVRYLQMIAGLSRGEDHRDVARSIPGDVTDITRRKGSGSLVGTSPLFPSSMSHRSEPLLLGIGRFCVSVEAAAMVGFVMMAPPITTLRTGFTNS